jgi:N6-L-threonylcarbamoyladenine synthase
MHEKYGGIVPEVAAREQLQCIRPVIEEALSIFQQYDNRTIHQCIRENIDAIAVTVGPGLIGSLLIGVETAKTIAFLTGKPIIPVNHVIAHMYASFVNDKQNDENNKVTIEFPAISLVVSGGHTELYLMKSVNDLTWLGGTLDDAAGECFDKCARLLGFGHGGGAAIEAAASRHSGKRVSERVQNPNEMLDKTGMMLPRPMLDESYNFSFSGLKTAVMREWEKKDAGRRTQDAGLGNAFSYEIQEAITDVLVKKTLHAASQYNAKSILLSGGVAANLRLREKLASTIKQWNNVTIAIPPVSLCTDNAVMVASCAYFRGAPADWHSITAIPDLSVENV